MVQPNPNFSVELNYLANELLKIGVSDTAHEFKNLLGSNSD